MVEDAHTISISFDTDHMSEDRMKEFLVRCQFPGEATYFCTQPYRSLELTKSELAPHPYLGKSSDWLLELRGKRTEFPQAEGWRSHSCVFSHIIAEWLAFNGYVYASTHDAFGETGLKPCLGMWGIWQIPIYYMDNLDFSQSRFWPSGNRAVLSKEVISRALSQPGSYVFDFHPIHLLLNTPDPATYMAARSRFLAGEDLRKLRHPGRGADTFFCDLIEAMERKNFKSTAMLDALLTFEPNAKQLTLEKGDYRFEDWRINDAQ
jgi:hypothetical protein